MRGEIVELRLRSPAGEVRAESAKAAGGGALEMSEEAGAGSLEGAGECGRGDGELAVVAGEAGPAHDHLAPRRVGPAGAENRAVSTAVGMTTVFSGAPVASAR